MSDGQLASQGIEVWLPEDLGHQSHVGVKAEVFSVGGSDTGALLPPMLQGEEAKKS